MGIPNQKDVADHAEKFYATIFQTGFLNTILKSKTMESKNVTKQDIEDIIKSLKKDMPKYPDIVIALHPKVYERFQELLIEAVK